MNKFKNLVQPYVVWISIFLVAPIFLLLLYAFSKSGNDTLTLQFTLDNFKRFFSDRIFIEVLINSFKIALMTTVICLLVGYPCAYLISKLKVKSGMFWIFLITMPTWINMLVRTYAWMGLLSEHGLIYSLLEALGFKNPQLLHNQFAVVLGMVYNFLPFMIIQIHASLIKIDGSLIEASHDLGANGWQTFKRVILPLSLPGVISGITLVFLPAVSSFVIPKLLGGGDQLLVGNLIENYFVSTGDWNFGSAISFIMAVLIMLSMFLTNRLDKEDK